jgi:CRP/FNR family transcriptional regulator
MFHTSPFIQRISSFLPIGAAAKPILAAVPFKTIRFEKSADILAIGSTGRQILAIGQGIAMRYRILPDGGRQVIMFLTPGDLCNPHIYPNEMDHAVAAVTETVVHRFDSETLVNLVKTDSSLNCAMWTIAELQNAIMRDQITSLGRGDARLRVARLLAELVQRLTPRGVVGPIMIPITQCLLADAIGVTHIHFNRVINEFTRRNIVDTCRGGIIVKDPPSLVHMAHEMTDAA